MNDETQSVTDSDEELKPKTRSKEEVLPEAKSYYRRYGLIYMNALNATGTAGWWLHSWLEHRPHWTWMVVIPLGSFVVSCLLNKLQWMSTISSLRTYRTLPGPITNTLGWVQAVVWLPLSFAQYLTTVHYPKNFFWYAAAVAIIISIIASRVDKVLAKR